MTSLNTNKLRLGMFLCAIDEKSAIAAPEVVHDVSRSDLESFSDARVISPRCWYKRDVESSGEDEADKLENEKTKGANKHHLEKYNECNNECGAHDERDPEGSLSLYSIFLKEF